MSQSQPPYSLRPTDKETLPLPVRSTRYIVGGILIAVIVTVVLMTYLRIEQQLQATVEGRLTAVLAQHVGTAERWISDTEKRALRTAGLVDETLALTEVGLSERLSRQFVTLRDTSIASEFYIVDPRTSGVDIRFPPDAALPPSYLKTVVQTQNTRVDFSTLSEVGRILAISPLPQTHKLLVLGIIPDELARGLNPETRADTSKTYAFNLSGWIDGPTRAASAKEAATTLPPTILAAIRRDQAETFRVSEYNGRQGEQVVGAWVWMSKQGFGIATEIPREEALRGIERLRQSFLVLVTLVGAALLGFLALGRWTLRVREESLLMTRRLTRLSRAIQPLSAALEHDPSAVLLADHEGTVVYANAASHRVLGVNAYLIGQDVDAVFESLPVELQSALASGQDSIVAQGSETDGETLLVSSRALSIDGAQHYLYMLRPVTQQVRRQEVEHWKKLIRVLSHELNNALAPITSLLSSARKVNQMTHQDPRLGTIFESISERTSHLISFIEGYREVARLPRPAPKSVEWETFLSGIESQKSFRRSGTVPESPGYFDPIQLERVAINLINNSFEAESPRQDVELEIIEEEDGFRINVQDRGTGMPEAVLKQAMLPFFSTKRTGTGVGLALSREIIEAHGGQLTLANREGGGLLASCFLPKAPQQSRGCLAKILIGEPTKNRLVAEDESSI